MAPQDGLSTLVARIEAALPPGHATQKRMFGGVTFLVDGNMLCCASKKGLMVRVGAAAEPTALSSPHARPCLGAGRRMVGFVMVDPTGFSSEDDLSCWLSMASAYVRTLPPKERPSRKQGRRLELAPRSTRRRA